jgi:hypothetical protein
MEINSIEDMAVCLVFSKTIASSDLERLAKEPRLKPSKSLKVSNCKDYQSMSNSHLLNFSVCNFGADSSEK